MISFLFYAITIPIISLLSPPPLATLDMSLCTGEKCPEIGGVWSRVLEQDPLDDPTAIDRSTLVLWTQAPKSGIYVDIRLPLGSPGRSNNDSTRPSAIAANGCEMTADQKTMDVMLRQKSFAGILTVHLGDKSNGVALADSVLEQLLQEPKGLPLCTCVWKREIDYQPPSGSLDVGVCASAPIASDGSTILRETGQDASYAEDWKRLPDTSMGPFLAMELVSSARKGYWVRAGPCFAYAIGRPWDPQAASAVGCPTESAFVHQNVGKSLKEATIEAESVAQKLAILGSYVAVAGKIVGDEWKIQYSTNPELVGCSLIGDPGDEMCCSLLQGSAQAKEGDTVEQLIIGGNGDRHIWKIVERTDCQLPVSNSNPL